MLISSWVYNAILLFVILAFFVGADNIRPHFLLKLMEGYMQFFIQLTIESCFSTNPCGIIRKNEK